MLTSAGGWVGHCSVSLDTHYVVSQSLIVTILTVICKLSVENHFIDMDVDGNVLLDTGVNELFREMTLYTELRWAVFGYCCVVL
jgi:hypothetical protein